MSVDFILTDLPYGYTRLKWDNIIDMDKMFDLFWTILKDDGLVVTSCVEPFTSKLIMANLKYFKYTLVWEKTSPSNHLNAKIMFMRYFEDIAIFYRSLPTFNPQMVDAPYRKDKPIRVMKMIKKQVYMEKLKRVMFIVMEINIIHHQIKIF